MDVFLEERASQDIERNSIVAVFLRHVEYYRGILFLTTNRITTFDEAFLSRIHVALHFRELTADAKAQIWAAFLRRVGVAVPDVQLAALAARRVNGREIKNATRTASSSSCAHVLCFSNAYCMNESHFERDTASTRMSFKSGHPLSNLRIP